MSEPRTEAHPYLSIIIPAYNESQRIGKTLERMREFFNGTPHSWEIVLVDDGSTDSTVKVAQEELPDNRLRVLRNPRNLGKGSSIRNGMLAARGEFVLFSDADLSTPIEELDKLLPYCQQGYDVAIGSRALKASRLEIRQPWYREFMGRVFNVLVRIIVLRGIKDTQCGFKLFTRRAAQTIFPQQRLSGFAFDVEVLLLARKAHYRIKEVPVRWINSPATRVSAVWDSLKMFTDLLKLRLGI